MYHDNIEHTAVDLVKKLNSMMHIEEPHYIVTDKRTNQLSKMVKSKDFGYKGRPQKKKRFEKKNPGNIDLKDIEMIEKQHDFVPFEKDSLDISNNTDEDCRYFDSTELKSISNYEDKIEENDTEEIWLEYASSKLEDNLTTEIRDNALNILVRALQKHPNSPTIWFAYLKLYRIRSIECEFYKVAEKAIQQCEQKIENYEDMALLQQLIVKSVKGNTVDEYSEIILNNIYKITKSSRSKKLSFILFDLALHYIEHMIQANKEILPVTFFLDSNADIFLPSLLDEELVSLLYIFYIHYIAFRKLPRNYEQYLTGRIMIIHWKAATLKDKDVNIIREIFKRIVNDEKKYSLLVRINQIIFEYVLGNNEISESLCQRYIKANITSGDLWSLYARLKCEIDQHSKSAEQLIKSVLVQNTTSFEHWYHLIWFSRDNVQSIMGNLWKMLSQFCGIEKVVVMDAEFLNDMYCIFTHILKLPVSLFRENRTDLKLIDVPGDVAQNEYLWIIFIIFHSIGRNICGNTVTLNTLFKLALQKVPPNKRKIIWIQYVTYLKKSCDTGIFDVYEEILNTEIPIIKELLPYTSLSILPSLSQSAKKLAHLSAIEEFSLFNHARELCLSTISERKWGLLLKKYSYKHPKNLEALYFGANYFFTRSNFVTASKILRSAKVRDITWWHNELILRNGLSQNEFFSIVVKSVKSLPYAYSLWLIFSKIQEDKGNMIEIIQRANEKGIYMCR
eukprot:TRINITY_DN5249_c0_g2_i1.p1 TRINITY_DN5249_c0_g2~~TRINITY_DN5249_c0_g2_i1.p1  ORF type:complete len:823 (-),score=127.71 TRINITY_DN5249_c0_g2_i1:28-2223(-)